MTLGGLAFVARNFALVLVPAYRSGSLVLLFLPGGMAMTVWFLVKGIDLPKWQEKAASSSRVSV
jgi:hypothetical protein